MEEIKLFKVFMSEAAPKAVSNVLLSGYIGEGEKVAEFEKKLGEYVGNPNVLCVNSGTSALMIALICAGVEPGDLVMSTPMTCLATNEAILALGARIHWLDVDMMTGIVTTESILKVIEDTRFEPSVLMSVDWGGLPCDVALFEDAGYTVISDSCQALGAFKPGAFASCVSFQAIKTLTTGDGGAIFFSSEFDLERARLLKWFGLDRNKSADMRCTQDPPELGYKMQMNDIAAAIGLENFKYLDRNLKRMKEIALRYKDAIGENHPELKLPYDPNRSSNWLCTLIVRKPADFMAYMKNLKIEASKVHDRNDTKKIFAPYARNLPGVDYFNRHHVCVPCGWWLTNDDVERVIKALKEYRNG